jgi:hypothetical protein
VHGATALAFAGHTGQFGRLAALPAGARLELATAVFVTAAGLTALIVAARPGVPDASADADGVRAYGSAPDAARPPHAPPPPSTLPPGW